MRGIFCLPFGFTPLTEVRRARRYNVLHSRNYYDPRLLRVTNRHSGYDLRGQPTGLVCSEVTKSSQCFWFKRSFAMPTSKTASCFCWVLFDSARPTRRVVFSRDDRKDRGRIIVIQKTLGFFCRAFFAVNITSVTGPVFCKAPSGQRQRRPQAERLT